MTVTVYSYDGEKNRLDKSSFLGTGTSHAGTVRDSVDIVNPSILVQGDQISGNYAYVDTFGAYYWIAEKTAVREGLTLLTMRRDPIQTFLSAIESAPCVVERSTNINNWWVCDNKRPYEQYMINQYIHVGKVGAPDTCILVTVG